MFNGQKVQVSKVTVLTGYSEEKELKRKNKIQYISLYVSKNGKAREFTQLLGHRGMVSTGADSGR